MQLWNQSIPNPRNQARSSSSGGGADFDSISKVIDAEDVGATTPCGLRAAMDSASTQRQLLQCNSGIHQFQTQEIKEDLQVQEAKLILIPLAKKIDAEDVGATTLCGLLAAMDSAQSG